MKTKFYNQLGQDDLIKSITRLTLDECFKSAVIRAVFIKDNTSEWKFLIGKCEIFHEAKEIEEIESIYSEYAFICKHVNEFNLKSFLSSLENEGLHLSDKDSIIIKSDSKDIFWNEEIIPSHATISRYPSRKYTSGICDEIYFNDTILLGYEMPFYQSCSDYLKKFMEIEIFHGNSDARKGELSIEIPDQRGKIRIENGQISIVSQDIDICLVGKTPLQNNLILKENESIEFDEINLIESELWLITSDNEIIDFRSQSNWEYRIDNLDDPEKHGEILLAIINEGESHTCEFKAYIEITKNKNSKVKEIEKTVCALSNAEGGHLFIGVTDDGCVEGVDNKAKEQYKMELDSAIAAYIQDIKIRLREILMDNQCFDISRVKIGTKFIVDIAVKRSEKLNYYLNTRQAYARKGATSFKMTSADEREKVDNPPFFNR